MKAFVSVFPEKGIVKSDFPNINTLLRGKNLHVTLRYGVYLPYRQNQWLWPVRHPKGQSLTGGFLICKAELRCFMRFEFLISFPIRDM